MTLANYLKRFVCCWKLRSQNRWAATCSSAVVVALVISILTSFRHYMTLNLRAATSIKSLEAIWSANKTHSGSSYQTFSVTKRTMIEFQTRAVQHFELDVPENRSIEVLMKHGMVVPASDRISSDTKIILWSVPMRYHPALSRLHPLRGCPGSPCRVTTNRYFHNQSDAVVFTAELLPIEAPAKLPNQVWILHNHESPRWSKAIRKKLVLYSDEWNSKFNWTMDYREDADLKAPYGLFKRNGATFEKRWPPIAKNYTNILVEKFTKPNATIAWMVSNCESLSRRHKYVFELSKYIKVDIFGECGTQKCPRKDDDKCFEYLSTHYKFYLAFENAFCKDYITEKLFRFYKSDMVMVVRGGGNYSRVTPPGTYINTADFRSPKHLAEYLNMLNVKDNAYMDILQEKDKFEPIFEEWATVKNGTTVYMTYHYDTVPTCQLCDRLHDLDKFRKHYTNIRSWFKQGVCYVPRDI